MESKQSCSLGRLVILIAIGLCTDAIAVATWKEGVTRTGFRRDLIKTEAALLFGAGWLPLAKALKRRKNDETATQNSESHPPENKHWELSTRLFS